MEVCDLVVAAPVQLADDCVEAVNFAELAIGALEVHSEDLAVRLASREVVAQEPRPGWVRVPACRRLDREHHRGKFFEVLQAERVVQ